MDRQKNRRNSNNARLISNQMRLRLRLRVRVRVLPGLAWSRTRVLAPPQPILGHLLGYCAEYDTRAYKRAGV